MRTVQCVDVKKKKLRHVGSALARVIAFFFFSLGWSGQYNRILTSMVKASQARHKPCMGRENVHDSSLSNDNISNLI